MSNREDLREIFSGMMMLGMLANGSMPVKQDGSDYDSFEEAAVDIAAGLIKELDKTKPKTEGV